MNKGQARREARRANHSLIKQQNKQRKKLGEKFDKWMKTKAPDNIKKDYVLAQEIEKRKKND